MPCQGAYHAHCYMVSMSDLFPVALTPKGDDVDPSDGWEATEAERHAFKAEYKTACKGDHLICQFQCHDCHFHNVCRCPPTDSSQDKWVLMCMRRAIIDSFWSRRPSTVESNLRECQRVMKLSRQLGLDSPMYAFPRGPFPPSDNDGMALAILMLDRSLAPGINSEMIQFNTVHGMRSFFSNSTLR